MEFTACRMPSLFRVNMTFRCNSSDSMNCYILFFSGPRFLRFSFLSIGCYNSDKCGYFFVVLMDSGKLQGKGAVFLSFL